MFVTTRPMLRVRCMTSPRATRLGVYPISCAIATTRDRVSSLIRPSPRSARLTVGWLTPATAAMSLIETRFLLKFVSHSAKS